MSKHARVGDGQVVEVFTVPEGFKIEDCFHPAVSEQFVSCGDQVEPGWIEEDGKFQEPKLPGEDLQ